MSRRLRSDACQHSIFAMWRLATLHWNRKAACACSHRNPPGSSANFSTNLLPHGSRKHGGLLFTASASASLNKHRNVAAGSTLCRKHAVLSEVHRLADSSLKVNALYSKVLSASSTNTSQ
eukprot:6052059-Pyramimonas_sp.AAC.1